MNGTGRVQAWSADLPGSRRVQRVLLIRWSAMGDVALASAGFESVRRAFPDAEIDVDTLPPWHRLFDGDPRFDRVHAFALRRGGRAAQLLESLRWLRAIRRRHYDLIVDLQSTDRSRIMISALWLLGAQVRFRLGNARRFPYNLAPQRSPEPVHALTRINRALGCAGIAPLAERPHLFVPQTESEVAQEKLRALRLRPGGYVVFLPGSQAAGYLKRWGAARFARLAELLAEHGVSDVLVLGGPDEVDECAAIAAGVRARPGARLHNLCGQTSLLELVPLCLGARFIVANDTGTAHVASASDRPMLVLCGPTDPRKVLPAGPRVRALQADLPCINCYRKHCAHHSCMVVMTPERVLQHLLAEPFFADAAPGGGESVA